MIYMIAQHVFQNFKVIIHFLKLTIMNILNNNARKINDLVFENRNKEYGAYAIRASYDMALLKSIGALITLLFISFGVAFGYSKMNYVEIVESIDLEANNVNPPIEIVKTIDITPPTQPEAAAAPLGTSSPTIFTNDAVETHSVANLENPNAGLGNENSTGTSATSTISSTNTITSVPETPLNGGTPSEVVLTAEMPEFSAEPNGVLKYVSGNIVYPEMAKNIGAEGTVHVTFVVNEFGKVDNVKVLKGIGYGCDEEVVRIITRMPKWIKAGKDEKGRPVRVRYNIPVRFKLK